MEQETREVKQAINVTWVKSETGHTYLCPANVAGDLAGMTDDHLRAHCVDESTNPHNN